MADDLSALTYEAALSELDEIIARLERGDVELEAAIAAYERGAALTRHCAQLLDRTEQTITQLVVGSAGEVERPFQPPVDGTAKPAATQEAAPVEQRLFSEPAPAAAPRGVPIDPDDIPF
ncbi:MAG: exodeoxyribonuclease VII small subunit [Candidatus Dormibacteraeota bacterium]|nr:exodeoxyribonuclease VII small subunit [Candidatus Dormibacteraeota bacterium]